jgi:hypothetical protein
MLHFVSPPIDPRPRRRGSLTGGGDLLLLLALAVDPTGPASAQAVIDYRSLLLYQWQSIRRVLE